MIKSVAFFLLYLATSVLFLTSYAQNIHDARKTVDTLASQTMHGRGYTNKGLKNAQEYIVGEFKKKQLKQFSKTYLQSFTHPVNTFPGAMHIEIDGKMITPGKDFIVFPGSAGFKGELPIAWLTDSILNNKKEKKNFISQDYSNSAIVIDTSAENKTKKTYATSIVRSLKKQPKVFIYVTNNKLTWSVSTEENKKTTEIVVVRDAIDKKSNKVKIDIENELLPEFTSSNIIGYIEGSQQPDSFVVFSAHYDHLGEMGKGIYFPGANDNASGISMLLNLADHYSKNPPNCSVVFIAFAGEELGLLGSYYYTHFPLFPLSKIKFLINMDIVGTGEEGITVVNGSIHKESFNSLVTINNEKQYLKQVRPRGRAMNSDHYFFSEQGVPAFFIYTMGGISAYHDIHDKAGTLPLTEFEDLFKLIISFADNF